MKLEDQVCNLQLSKKLKSLNVKQESLFYWEKCPDHNYEFTLSVSYNDLHDTITGEWTDCHILKEQEIYSSFTVAELFDLLPAFIDTKKDEPFSIFYIKLEKKTSKNIQYIVNYYSDIIDYCEMIMSSHTITKNIYDEKLSDCLAKMLIYLIENKLIEI